ncbi:hypothetical protein ASF30_01985 [Leifsonia sp. Leaf264]|nr:hypothetical protein ASF30_01985 [Leifsonia sp. Leaf264]
MTVPASAATTGAGFEDQTPAGGFLGNYVLPDGTRGYCADVQLDWPSGSTGGNSSISTLDATTGTRAVGGDDIRRLNFILGKYGQTADPVQAAAVSAAVYGFTSANWAYPGGSLAGAQHYVDADGHGINARLQTIWDDMSNHWADGVTGSPSGSITYSIAHKTNYSGTVSVAYAPAAMTGTLTLSNAVFTDSGSTSRAISGPGTFSIKGKPADGQTHFNVATTVNVGAAGGYDQEIKVAYTGSQQRLISGTGATPVTWKMTVSDPDEIAGVFSPVISTQVSTRFLDAGEKPVDRLTFSTAAGSDPWRRLVDGRYIPVEATGTLYGPLATQPARMATVKPSWPVAATTTLTTSLADGPTKAYTAEMPAVAADGYYTWVWRIQRTDQAALTQTYLPGSYSWRDDAWIPGESQLVLPKWHTETSAAQTTPGTSITDTLVTDGIAVPSQTTVRFSSFKNPPAGALTCSAANRLTQSGWLTVGSKSKSSAALPLTMAHVNTRVVWQAEVRVEGTPVWTEPCGSPSEVTKVTVPTFATTASTAETTPGTSVSDLVQVVGFVPAAGIEVTVQAFRIDPASPVCSASTLAWSSPIMRVITAGTVTTAEMPLTMADAGTITFVATSKIGGVQIWQDDCGVPAESVRVSVPTFKTDATDESTPGSTAADRVTVDGYVPAVGVDVTFEAFNQPEDAVAPVCSPENRVLLSSSPTRLTAAGPATSETFNLDMTHAGTLLWVATATIGGIQVWQDTCGSDPDESTLVLTPVIITDALDRSVPGSTVTDTATVTGFLRSEGIDLTFEGFRQDPAGDGTPVCLPENRVYNSTAPTHLAEAGDALSEQFEVLMSDVGEGANDVTILWVATAHIGTVQVWQDVCGQNPDEASKLTLPTVTTTAEPFATPLSTVRDQVKVDGFLPPEGLNIQYNGYLQPTKDDNDETTPITPVCRDNNRIYQSRDLQHFTDEGDRKGTSEDFNVLRTDVGTIYWQEVASVDGTVVHVGECGNPDETTQVAFPTFVTDAAQGYIGENAYDVATVTGLVAEGSYLRFTAYLQPKGDEAVQADSAIFNKSWADKRFPVTGESTAPAGQLQNDQTSTIQSDGVLVTQLGTIRWIGSLYGPDDQLISAGDFNDPSEMTVLKRSKIKGITMESFAFSGFNASSLLTAIGAITLLAAALMLAALIMYRRQRKA